MIATSVILGEGEMIHHPDLVSLYGCKVGSGTRIGTFVESQKNAAHRRDFPGSLDIRVLTDAIELELNFSDGRHSLLDIAGRSGMGFAAIRAAADTPAAHQLLK